MPCWDKKSLSGTVINFTFLSTGTECAKYEGNSLALKHTSPHCDSDNTLDSPTSLSSPQRHGKCSSGFSATPLFFSLTTFSTLVFSSTTSIYYIGQTRLQLKCLWVLTLLMQISTWQLYLDVASILDFMCRKQRSWLPRTPPRKDPDSPPILPHSNMATPFAQN